MKMKRNVPNLYTGLSNSAEMKMIQEALPPPHPPVFLRKAQQDDTLQHTLPTNPHPRELPVVVVDQILWLCYVVSLQSEHSIKVKIQYAFPLRVRK